MKKFERGFIDGKLYDYVPLGFKLSYEDALEQAKNGCFISREDWSGFHFIDIAPDGTETYIIVLKDGNIMFNPKEIYDTDKEDWGVVNIVNKDYKMAFGKFVIEDK